MHTPSVPTGRARALFAGAWMHHCEETRQQSQVRAYGSRRGWPIALGAVCRVPCLGAMGHRADAHSCSALSLAICPEFPHSSGGRACDQRVGTRRLTGRGGSGRARNLTFQTPSSRGVSFTSPTNEADASGVEMMEGGVGTSKSSMLGHIAGCCNTSGIPDLARTLFRATRGNMLLKHEEIEDMTSDDPDGIPPEPYTANP